MIRSCKTPHFGWFHPFHPPFFSLYDTQNNTFCAGDVPAFLPLNLGRGSAAVRLKKVAFIHSKL